MDKSIVVQPSGTQRLWPLRAMRGSFTAHTAQAVMRQTWLEQHASAGASPGVAGHTFRARSSPLSQRQHARRGPGRLAALRRSPDSSNKEGSNAGAVLPVTAAGRSYRAAVGIDLGTTTSAVAVSGPDGRPLVVEDEAGRAVIPSVVFVRQDGSVLVGDEAVAAAEGDPANAFYGIKRLMGRTHGEALRELDDALEPAAQPGPGPGPGLGRPQHQARQAPERRRRLRSYSVVEGAGGRVEVACPALGRNLTPQEISTHLIRHLVSRARSFLERQHQQQEAQRGSGPGHAGAQDESLSRAESAVEVLDAVITVPAHFSPVQRRAVVEAAREAGLQRVTLLQEPIAAAMAYGFGSPHVPYDVLLVFDLGGGTLDLTIVEAFDGIMEVLSTSGDNYLGGDDFTAAVADWIVEQYQQQQQRQRQQLQHLQHHQQQQQVAGASAAQGQGQGVTPKDAPASKDALASKDAPTSKDALAVLRLAEAAKLALSEAEAAVRAGGHGATADDDLRTPSIASTSAGAGATAAPGAVVATTSSTRGVSSVRIRLPSSAVHPAGCSDGDGDGGGSAGGSRATAGQAPATDADAEVELTHGTFEELVRPLLQRFWWPLQGVAMATRTQLGGHLPPHLDPRLSSETDASSDPDADGNGSSSSSSSSAGSWSLGSYGGSGSGSGWDLGEGPGRREGAAAWEFSIFPSPPGGAQGAGGSAAKYVAPPRRLSGLVLVGAATRLPVVRDYITTVTGLSVRPGVDPETAVALGAALHAGLMVGSVAGGIEMNDGGYVAGQHGRASGFQMAAGEELLEVASTEEQQEEELVWEP